MWLDCSSLLMWLIFSKQIGHSESVGAAGLGVTEVIFAFGGSGGGAIFLGGRGGALEGREGAFLAISGFCTMGDLSACFGEALGAVAGFGCACGVARGGVWIGFSTGIGAALGFGTTCLGDSFGFGNVLLGIGGGILGFLVGGVTAFDVVFSTGTISITSSFSLQCIG